MNKMLLCAGKINWCKALLQTSGHAVCILLSLKKAVMLMGGFAPLSFWSVYCGSHEGVA
jgi:hypothetical protein